VIHPEDIVIDLITYRRWNFEGSFFAGKRTD